MSTLPRFNSAANHLVLVDALLPDLPVLLSHLPSSAQVCFIHDHADALNQLAQAAAAHSPLEGLHILGHGEPGRMLLGNQWVHAQSIGDASEALQTLAAALGDDAHIWLYGCNSGLGPAGERWLDAWALATGVAVHATDSIWQAEDASLPIQRGAGSTITQLNPLQARWQHSQWEHTLATAPTIAGLPGTAQGVTAGTSAALTDFTVADADGDNLTVTLTTTNGTLGNLTDADVNTAGIQLIGTAASINAAISGATFVATQAGAASIGISVSDGVVSSPTTDTYNLTATAAVVQANTSPTFSTGTGNGTVTLNGGQQTDGVSDGGGFLQQPDGKMVVAYTTSAGNNDFALIRLNQDGSFDTGFGVSGKARVPVGLSTDSAKSLILQADGKLVVAGYSLSGSFNKADFSVARLNADGSLDSSFGTGGTLSVDVTGTGVDDLAYSVVQQADGKLVLGGYSQLSSGNSDFSLVRLNTDGSLDSSFGTAGKVLVPVGADFDNGRTLTLQPDGKLVMAGQTSTDLSLIRLNANGSLDSSFGTGGKTTLSLPATNDNPASITVQSDGKLVVVGNSSSSSAHVSVVRLNANGSLDTSFADAGVLIDNLLINGQAKSVIQQTDGKLVVAAQVIVPNQSYDIALLRLNADGSRDTTFGTDGVVTRSIRPESALGNNGSTNYSEVPFQVIQLADGKLAVTGRNDLGELGIFRVNPDGSPDTTFGGTATTTLGGTVAYTEGAAAVRVDTTVEIIDVQLAALNNGAGDYSGASLTLARQGGASTQDLLGISTAGASFTVSGSNLQSGGQTFATFSSVNGALTLQFTGSGTTPTQALVNDVLSRITYANSSSTPPASVNLAWNFSDGNSGGQGAGGALSATGTSTVNITVINAVPTLTGIPGTAQSVTVGTAAALADFTVADADGDNLTVTLTATNGTLGNLTDADANTAGTQLTGTAASINAAIAGATFTANGAGSASIGISVGDGVAANPTTGTYKLAVPSNSNPTFNAGVGTGKVVFSLAGEAKSVAKQADGKLVLVGRNGSDVGVVRLNDDGSADLSFSGDGKLIVNLSSSSDVANSVTVLADGTLAVAGHAGDAPAVIRLLPDGTFDNAFDGDGKLTFSAGDDGHVSSVIQQSDGQLVVAGSRTIFSTDEFFVSRFNSNGSPDNSFAFGSRFSGNFGGDSASGNAVVQQSDGKLVVVGNSFFGANGDFGIARLDGNGNLDLTFSGDGKLRVDLGSLNDIANSVIQQSDGKLVVAGFSGNGSSRDFSLIRLHFDGRLDESFSTDGKLLISVGSGDDRGLSVIQQSDGKLVVAGYSANGSNADFSLVRVNGDGSLDTSFGVDGKVLLALGAGNDEGYSVIQQLDGKLLVVGSSEVVAFDPQFAIARLNPDGSLDTSFGGSAASTLGSTMAYTEGAAAVRLDSAVQIVDAQLAALNGGAGDYSGATLILARQGGASTQDVLGISSAGASFTISGSNLQSGGQTFATFNNMFGSGSLVIVFTDSGTAPTQALVNDVLSHITYANASNTPPASVNLEWTFSDGNSGSQGTGGALSATGTSMVNITAVDNNTAPSFSNTLGGTVAYTEGANNVRLDNSVRIVDAQLAALNGGDGNYSGASLTLARAGGASVQDVFDIDSFIFGTYSVSGSNLQRGGQTFGTFTSSNGTLNINFTGTERTPTQELVNDVLSRITYANSSNTPPSSVNLAWSFSDGNSGSQGTGGALTASGTTTVNITAVNDVPTIAGIPETAQSVTAGTASALVNFTVADADGNNLTVTLTTANGSLGNLSDANANTEGIQLTGTAASINAAISAATFTASAVGVASIGISASDGVAATPTTGTYNLVASGPANTAPTFGGTVVGAVAYTEGAAPVRLDSAVEIFDAQLAALNNGAGNYSGSTITISRQDGVNSLDILRFSPIGPSFTFSGSNLQSGGQTFGTVTSNTNGIVGISFTDSGTVPTQALMNDVLSHITYLYGGSAPPASVNLEWSFSDGNSGSQGTGGALTAIGTTTVNITAVNSVPTLSGLPSTAQSVTVGTAAALADFTVADGDGDNLTVTLTVTNGTLRNLFDADANTAGIQVTGSGSSVNAAISGATFVATTAGAASIGISVSDGVAASPTTGTYSFTANAAPQNSAPAFISPGKVVVNVGAALDSARSVVQQADGKLVVAGDSVDGLGNSRIGLVRLNADGSLDTTFSADGKLNVSVGSADYGQSVLQQADGKLVVLGSSYIANTSQFSMVRLNADGSLDTTFSSDGKFVLSPSTVFHKGGSVIQQADGKLVWAGYSNTTNATDGEDFSLIRLNADGSLDSTFSNDGRLVVPVGSRSDVISSVIQQADGKLLVAGFSENASGVADFSLVRLTADGSFDTSFSGDGILVLPVGSAEDYGRDVIQQTDGKLVIVGRSSGSGAGASIVRLNTDGSLDTSFSGDGKLIVSNSYEADSVIQQADGKLVIVGSANFNEQPAFSVTRLNADGSSDTTFGVGGTLVVQAGSQSSGSFLGGSYSIIQQADGKLVVTGSSELGTDNKDFLVFRLNPDGSLDSTFVGSAGNTLGGTVGYTEGSAAVRLDTAVEIVDAQLAALNSGAGNYSGATLVLARQGGASTQDLLAISTAGASFTVSGNNLQSGGQTFATFNNMFGSGSMVIVFTDSGTAPTQALVNDVLSHITYSNSSSTPPSSVNLEWSFSDGNSGSQGSGGALNGTGISTVNITPFNLSPRITGFPGTVQSVTVGSAAALADFTVADADGDNLTVTLTTTNGALGNLTDVNSSLPGIQLTGTAASINAAIAGATFTASQAGAASISISVSDGIVANPSIGTYNLTAVATPTNTRPSFGNTLGGTVSYTEDRAGVALDSSVEVMDVQLAALNNGNGDYSGATLVIERQGGISPDDFLVLNPAGSSFTVGSGGKLLSGGLVFADYLGGSGRLSIAFTGSNTVPTQALVNDVLSRITYANQSNDPPASVVLSWTFREGNGGVQGAGGSLSAIGTSTVVITSVNDTPTITGIPGTAQNVTVGTAAALTNFTVADADGDNLTVTLTATNGTLGNLPDANSSTPGIQLTGTAASINAAIAGAAFVATAAGAASIGIRVSDGVEPLPVVGTYRLAATGSLPSASTESQVPGIAKPGVPAVTGDGNGDGIADNQQAAVASEQFTINQPTAGGLVSSFVTLVARSDVTNLLQQDAPLRLPAQLKAPLGQVVFTANVGTAGATDTFSLYVDQSLRVNGYWVDAGNGFWVNLASAAFGGQMVREGDKLRLDFNITDGGPLDRDGVANGLVTLVGMPASLPQSALEYSPDVPGAGGFFL